MDQPRFLVDSQPAILSISKGHGLVSYMGAPHTLAVRDELGQLCRDERVGEVRICGVAGHSDETDVVVEGNVEADRLANEGREGEVVVPSTRVPASLAEAKRKVRESVEGACESEMEDRWNAHPCDFQGDFARPSNARSFLRAEEAEQGGQHLPDVVEEWEGTGG